MAIIDDGNGNVKLTGIHLEKYTDRMSLQKFNQTMITSKVEELLDHVKEINEVIHDYSLINEIKIKKIKEIINDIGIENDE
tara:strand:+ start:4100 stop:4342 length:243 start_codon:yes stop_codon:yes gene_type:complete